MTRKKWHECMGLLKSQLEAAERSGDRDYMLGVAMATEAFLRLPVPPLEPVSGDYQ